METLIPAVCIVVGAAGLSWGLVGLVVEARKKRRPIRERMVECAVCGEELPISEAVVLTGRVTQDRDTFSVTIAEYHKECERSLTQP